VIVCVQDNQSQRCCDADYYPFGGEQVYLDTCPQNYKVTHSARPPRRTRSGQAGKERDPESGLDYFVARHYASSPARFMSADPLFGSPGNPQSLNRYAYTLNNPLRAQPAALALPCTRRHPKNTYIPEYPD